MQITKKSLLFLVAILLCFSASAQYKNTLKKAEKQYELKAFNLAIENYESVLEKRQGDPEAMGNLADCYRHLNQMEKAAEWYEKVIERYNRMRRSDKVNPIHYLNYGLVLKSLGDYQQARRMFRIYSEENPSVGNHYAQSCNFAEVQRGVASSYQVSLEFVNTSASDFGPSFLGDQVVFSSARTDILRSSSNWTGKANNQLFIAAEGTGGYLESPLFLKSNIKNAYNEGPIAYSPDGRTVVYTKNNFVDGTRQIPSSGMQLSLFIAEVSANGSWIGAQPFRYNGTSYSTGFPSFSPDGNRLYFASDRPDGFGGFDLFVSYKLENGNWSTPENLGPVVNSPGNEVTPYFDGNMLFFASDWHQGLGGYDIFRAEQSGGRWSRIFHLGNSVNSTRDDYGFIYDSFKNVGYFTSNRPGGKGNEDIYKVSKSSDNIVLRVKNASDGSPIANAIIDFSSCNEGKFRADGRGVYSFQAVDGLNCTVIVSQDGYLSSSLQINTIGLRQSREFDIMLSRIGEEYAGRILNYRSGTPVAGVSVVATNQNTSSSIEATSDVNGDYSLALSPGAIYILRYSRPGYRDVNRTVRTGDGFDRTVLGTISLLATSANFDEVDGSDPIPISPDPITEPDPEPTISSGYSVQVAAVKTPNMSEYANLESLGTVYPKSEGNLYKIRVGVFATRGEASQVLRSVKSKGYKGAWIVKEEGVQSTSGQPNESEFSPREPVFKTSKYMVQLAAYRDASWFDDSGVRGLGTIETKNRGGWTVKYLSGFDTLYDAQQALRKAKSVGFNTAFIVSDENGELKKVN
jgi:tetratricopeptide (TPR) repeat protein